MNYYNKWLLSLAVSAFSGVSLVYFATDRLAVGDTSAWIGMAISFVVFGISAPVTVYYRGRRFDKSIDEKLLEALKQESPKFRR